MFESSRRDHEQQLNVLISKLLDLSGVHKQRKLVTSLLRTSLGLGADSPSRVNLKLTSAALSEMRNAFKLFACHEGTRKVTIFGSARTLERDPLWVQAENIARVLAQKGWMTVTGAGPGIMQAAAQGAGPGASLGVSIRLPFEEKPNGMVSHEANHVAMKYFFTRKLMLVKESSGFVCLPGGFGTLDETFELLTLQQTGKMAPSPIVLLDRPGGTFWAGFEGFVREQLGGYGMISAGDLDRVMMTDSVGAAVAEIENFWSNYDSLRWVPDRSGQVAEVLGRGVHEYDRLVLRVHRAPSVSELVHLNEQFSDMLAEGVIEVTSPLGPEISDGDRLSLPRLTFVPKPREIGQLYRLIRVLNTY